MKNQIQELTRTELEYFKSFLEVHTYNSQTQVIYHGQVPMAAYILIEGKIDLKNARDKLIRVCEPNVLVGFSEIYNNMPFKYTAEIEPGSKVLIIDRTAVKTIKNDLESKSIHHKVFDIVS